MLPRGSRLNINWFDGELNIPTNTVEWHGQFQLRTAYESGFMVIDAGNIFIYIQDIPATNTVRPADDTRAEHLDAGSPNDLINASKSGLTFTFVRRSGDNINLTFTSADLVTAAEGMTTGQKVSFRAAIEAAAATHNHDDRYYTETEVDNLLNGKANTIHNHDGRYYTETEADSRFLRRTTSALVSLINSFSESQEDQVRRKIEAWGAVSVGRQERYYRTYNSLAGNSPPTNLQTFTADLFILRTRSYSRTVSTAPPYALSLRTGSIRQVAVDTYGGATLYNGVINPINFS